MIILTVVKIASLLIAGVGGGYLVSRLLCSGGACPILANRGLMAMLGGMLGLYLSYTFGWLGLLTASAEASPALPALRTSEELDKALSAGRPVVVDFYADWCGPCGQMKPVVHKAEKHWRDKVDFYAVDVDAAPDLARRFGVQSIPTLVYFAGGQEADRTVGVIPAADLSAKLEKLTK